MKVVSYLSSVPANNKKTEKTDILNYFVEGVNRSADQGIIHWGSNLIDCDVEVIQGWVHENSKTSTHLILRKTIIEYQKSQRKKVLVADSNLFLYVNKENPHHYLRYSFNDVFPITGEYFWKNPNPDRWKAISRDLNIELKDWKSGGDNILICTQRNGGWSMKGFDVVTWLENTVTDIRKYTDRPIVVRPHPGDKNAVHYLNSKDTRWRISSTERITDDFASARAVVTFNSSPGVAAAIEGIPVFVTDPQPQISQAYDVANTDLSLIETPKTFDRQAWIEKISMSHWSFADLKSGKAWEHIRKYI